MPEIIALDQHSGWVTLGASGMRVRAPILTGNLIWYPPADHPAIIAATMAQRPTAAVVPDPVEEALNEAGLTDLGSIGIPSGAASVAGPPNQFVLDRQIAPGRVEFAIYRDESGIISLHRPLPSPPAAAPPAAAVLRAPVGGLAPRTFHYSIPLRHAAIPAGGVAQTAMFASLAGKVIRIVGRAVSGVVGDAVYGAAKIWEDKFRAEQGFHGGANPDQLLVLKPAPSTLAQLTALQGQKSLLFIHGTISSTVGGYLGLKQFPSQAAALFAKYSNRVIGFNHHTLTKSVPQNTVDFFSGLPRGDYQFDVIGHSRGGLVARALKELTPAVLGQLVDPAWTPAPGVNVQIEKIVLVGTPNVGTPLANPSDLPETISRLASMATALSQDVAAVGLGALFAIFGGIVESGIGALPGLEDMNPGNPFLQQLNAASNDITAYYGIQADFQPTGGLATAIQDDGIDALFLDKANDLVVPTLGVSDINGQTLPGVRIDSYPQSANVYHTDYFSQQGTWDSIVQFLP